MRVAEESNIIALAKVVREDEHEALLEEAGDAKAPEDNSEQIKIDVE